MNDYNLTRSIQRWEYEGGRLLPRQPSSDPTRQEPSSPRIHPGHVAPEHQKPHPYAHYESDRAHHR